MAHKHMKLKNPKSKSKFVKVKILFYLIVIYVSFSYTFYYSLKNTKRVSNEEFINLMVSTGNANIFPKYKVPNLVNATMKLLLKIDFTKPVSILNSSILKYGKKEEVFDKTISLEYNDDYSNMDDLKKVSKYITDPSPEVINNPLVYLYNSHQLENYNNDNLDIYGITPNVLMASYLLRERLTKLNIPTIVETANMSSILEKNNWDYSYSYRASRGLLVDKISKYKTLKYFIDIHRDSVGGNLTKVSINGKTYAKILFIIGLDHNNWEPNYNMAVKLNNKLDSSYPNLSRGIMKKTGINVNGIYNQDVSNNCILIEVGGVDNNIEEVYNTMDAIAQVLSTYIKGE